ncbi:hypothetical protein SUGI_0210290 [Cryptomeria japonica]|uniref:uncharacterized protein LOC131071007 n=1 Tax=Cryptomeria japonica TaxID=3369 RepID=UPI0024089916|nr:uncharacterized protein LOC131071007 [Cryptomeria japonica]GLJ13327.1 hypothetical protein SUGI_0210290 [Cryptomeria japonica]
MAKCIQAILIVSLFLVIPSVLASEKENIIALPSEQKACSKNYESVSCPVSCFRADPVCGVNGITYWCGCAEALCAGVEVAKVGFCPVGSNGGSGLLTGQALLLVHIVWLILLGFIVLIGLP